MGRRPSGSTAVPVYVFFLRVGLARMKSKLYIGNIGLSTLPSIVSLALLSLHVCSH